jgi:predicted DNA-binding transcriptional regulator AlpA
MSSKQVAFFRLPQVLKLVSVSRSSWYDGVKSGKYPPGIKIGPNTRV